MYIRFGFWLV